MAHKVWLIYVSFSLCAAPAGIIGTAAASRDANRKGEADPSRRSETAALGRKRVVFFFFWWRRAKQKQPSLFGVFCRLRCDFGPAAASAPSPFREGEDAKR